MTTNSQKQACNLSSVEIPKHHYSRNTRHHTPHLTHDNTVHTHTTTQNIQDTHKLFAVGLQEQSHSYRRQNNTNEDADMENTTSAEVS